MVEKRKFNRIHLIHYLRVFDRKTNDLIGNLVDLTSEGLQLICETPIEKGKLLELRMEFPEEVDGERQLFLNAETIWCDHELDPDLFSVGCKLLPVTPTQVTVIRDLIDNYQD
ncbi:MAG: hypothetical protein GYA12_01055 [Chloroflexi bacterium]|nr:hypothetical protein [Chloroflexota bacterium]BCY19338.1 hypothetical protein hrd7_31870 [Leptolinea sp. HRD-7]